MKILFVVGTRPEAIKLAPVILECRTRPNLETIVCSTGQHREMLAQTFSAFGIEPDSDLGLMTKNQSLTSFSAAALSSLGSLIEEIDPGAIIVQGDTTTAMIGALSAFYHQIPTVHVEAGLRTWDRFNPYPEEINRAVIDQIAEYCMAPTEQSKENLLRTGVELKNIWVTGNTSVDAVLSTVNRVLNSPPPPALEQWQSSGQSTSKTIVVTGHRRESFGDDFESICRAIKQIADENPNVEIVYPVHLNPNVQDPVFRILDNCKNIALIDPLPYDEFVWLLANCHLVLSDSGGIQEEVPSLNKPVLVMREKTERPEGVDAGCSKLVGVKQAEIVRNVNQLLNDEILYTKMSSASNPYGDGKASQRIADVLSEIKE